MTAPSGDAGEHDQPPDYLAPSGDADPSADRQRGGRRWLPWVIAVDVVVAIVVVTGILGAHAGWFSGDSGSRDQGARLVSSTPKALTAAVLAHVPSDVTIVWSNGNDDLDKLMPGRLTSLKGALTTSILLEKDAHQFYLSVLTSPAPQGSSAPEMTLPRRDGQGRVVSELLLDSTSTTTTILMEVAGPGGAGLLPLSASDLQDLVKDPLVSPSTTPRMLAGSQDVPSWDPQGVISWPHSPI